MSQDIVVISASSSLLSSISHWGWVGSAWGGGGRRWMWGKATQIQLVFPNFGGCEQKLLLRQWQNKVYNESLVKVHLKLVSLLDVNKGQKDIPLQMSWIGDQISTHHLSLGTVHILVTSWKAKHPTVASSQQEASQRRRAAQVSTKCSLFCLYIGLFLSLLT